MTKRKILVGEIRVGCGNKDSNACFRLNINACFRLNIDVIQYFDTGLGYPLAPSLFCQLYN